MKKSSKIHEKKRNNKFTTEWQQNSAERQKNNSNFTSNDRPCAIWGTNKRRMRAINKHINSSNNNNKCIKENFIESQHWITKVPKADGRHAAIKSESNFVCMYVDIYVCVCMCKHLLQTAFEVAKEAAACCSVVERRAGDEAAGP